MHLEPRIRQIESCLDASGSSANHQNFFSHL